MIIPDSNSLDNNPAFKKLVEQRLKMVESPRTEEERIEQYRFLRNSVAKRCKICGEAYENEGVLGCCSICYNNLNKKYESMKAYLDAHPEVALKEDFVIIPLKTLV